MDAYISRRLARFGSEYGLVVAHLLPTRCRDCSVCPPIPEQNSAHASRRPPQTPSRSAPWSRPDPALLARRLSAARRARRNGKGMPSRHREQSAASVYGVQSVSWFRERNTVKAIEKHLQLVVAISAACPDGFQVADFFAESERSAHQPGTKDTLADRSRRCDDQVRTQVSREHQRR